jgi:hypothetical protein
MLQWPLFHLTLGSGQTEQNQPEAYSLFRLQPSQGSTVSWQIPPLYEHPLAVIKGHS